MCSKFCSKGCQKIGYKFDKNNAFIKLFVYQMKVNPMLNTPMSINVSKIASSNFCLFRSKPTKKNLLGSLMGEGSAKYCIVFLSFFLPKLFESLIRWT